MWQALFLAFRDLAQTRDTLAFLAIMRASPASHKPAFNRGDRRPRCTKWWVLPQRQTFLPFFFLSLPTRAQGRESADPAARADLRVRFIKPDFLPTLLCFAPPLFLFLGRKCNPFRDAVDSIAIVPGST